MNTILPADLIGVAWRHELAHAIDTMQQLSFVEVMFEMLENWDVLPPAIESMKSKGVPIVVHAVTMSLGTAESLDLERIRRLGEMAQRLGAPLVSEHISFVHAGGLDSGHLIPLPRDQACLEVLIENVCAAQSVLPVPLALENIAALFDWPNSEMDEATFIAELLERTDALLLLDLSNLYANAHNLVIDPINYLERLPLERVAYVHIAGGEVREDGLYHDTHAASVSEGVLDLLQYLCARIAAPPVLLERDALFPTAEELSEELRSIMHVMELGHAQRKR